MRFTPLLIRLGRLALRVARGGAFVYAGLLLILLFLENKLLYPAPRYPAGDWNPPYLPHEDATFTSSDGTRLHGWFVEHEAPRAIVLYCHGNGECVSYLGPYLQHLHDRHHITVLAFDYRGYGKSEGSPNEAGVLADGRAAQRWLAERTGCQPADIVLFGRSLGGCVAVDLAASEGARGLILQSTTTTIPDAAAAIYWFAPVQWLMKNRYDSLSKIGRFTGPLLMSHGTTDTIIPYRLGRRLFDAATSNYKRFFVIEEGDHNDPEPPEYDEALDAFFAALTPAHGN